MKLITILEFLLISILPFLLFLLILNFAGFDNSFYKEKFSEYQIQKNIPAANSLHEKVMNFINGKNSELPNDFNDREKQHLWDVRGIVKISTILLYMLIIIFVFLLLVSAITLKVNNVITNFTGKVLVFGGSLGIMLAAILFLFINSNFSAAFDSFHKLFFPGGSYAFDPAKEIIVQLYPEQLFMDLGIRISTWAIIASLIVILLGALLLFKSKKNKY